MSMNHSEGFEIHNTVDLLTDEYPTSTLSGATIGSGRLGWGSTIKFDHTVLGKIQTPLLPVKASWGVGFAFKVTTKTADGLLLRVKTALGVVQVSCTIKHNSATGFVLEARQGDVGAAIYSSGTSAELAYDAWHFIEFLFVINSTTGGLFRIYNDGSLIVNKSATNTANGDASNQNAAIFEFGGQGFSSGAFVEFDDMYFLDTLGGAPLNVRLGEIQIEGKLPNSDGAGGAPSEWTASSGVDKYALINDDDDATLITAPSNDLEQAIGYSNLAHTTGDVLCVHVKTYMKLSASGTRNMRVNQYESDGTGTKGTGGTRAITNTAPLLFHDIFATEPSTTDPWTAAKVNADAFGVESLA